MCNVLEKCWEVYVLVRIYSKTREENNITWLPYVYWNLEKAA